MANTSEIINAISSIVSQYGHDGALDSSGEKKKIGLKREEGVPLIDNRVMDGFGVKFFDNKLIIKYQSECLLKDVHNSKFEQEIEGMINDIAKFIKNEYKIETGKDLTLTPDKDFPVNVFVQNISRIRTLVQAEKVYKIGGISSNYEDKEKRLDDAVKNFLKVGKKDSKPENVKIKPKDNQAPKQYDKKGI